MDEPEPVVILITFPTDGDVIAFARGLVGEGSAACVTVLPEVQSVYRWDGAIEQARERQLIVKTTRDMVDRLRHRVTEVHPYDTPEFLVLRVAGGEERYLAWIRDAVGAGGPKKAGGRRQTSD